MKSIVTPVLLGLTGAALGFFIPVTAQKIALYKSLRKNSTLEPDLRYTSLPLSGCTLLANAAFWTFTAVKIILPAAIPANVLFTLSIIISLVDLRIRIIPNELLLMMLLAGSAYQILCFGLRAFLFSIFCMLAMIILFASAAGAVGFGKVGAGDVKLAGAMGLALGYPSIITALLVMSAVLFIFGVLGIASKRLALSSLFPFAPFMMTGMVAALITTACA